MAQDMIGNGMVGHSYKNWVCTGVISYMLSADIFITPTQSACCFPSAIMAYRRPLKTNVRVRDENSHRNKISTNPKLYSTFKHNIQHNIKNKNVKARKIGW